MVAIMRILALSSVIGLLTGCATGRAGGPPRVDHLRIEVTNMQASVAFYRDLIGLRPRSVTADFSVLEAANLGIFLSASPWPWVSPRGKEERAGWGMYPHFEVADVRALTERAAEAGYKVVQEPKDHSFGTEAFVADPDGYTWALFSWKRGW